VTFREWLTTGKISAIDVPNQDEPAGLPLFPLAEKYYEILPISQTTAGKPTWIPG
jgi:hypothetical protein